ncbi:unnamed protein product [Rhodiola kirilowii]
MSQPECCISGNAENTVYLLNKSVYGLKQSPRQWYKRFDEFMLSCDFKRSSYDWCIYYKYWDNGSTIYLLLYVDDMLIASDIMQLISDLKEQLNAQFEMKDLGHVKKILGCLMYSMVCTRPDIAHSVSMVSRFMSKPGKTHWDAVKWVLRYVKGSVGKGLMFGKANAHSDIIMGFVDFDFAGCLDSRKSQTGYVFIVYGTAVS